LRKERCWSCQQFLFRARCQNSAYRERFLNGEVDHQAILKFAFDPVVVNSSAVINRPDRRASRCYGWIIASKMVFIRSDVGRTQRRVNHSQRCIPSLSSNGNPALRLNSWSQGQVSGGRRRSWSTNWHAGTAISLPARRGFSGKVTRDVIDHRRFDCGTATPGERGPLNFPVSKKF